MAVPVYRASLVGRRKPVLIKADSAAKAMADLVELESLTAKELCDLADSDEKPWKKGQPLPAEDDAAELEWLRFFHRKADFGPADGDVRLIIAEAYGKPLPEGYAEETDDEGEA